MITALAAAQVGPYLWRLSWASDDADASFRVYRDGELLQSTDAAELLVQVWPGESPAFEVIDDPLAAPAPAYPADVTLAWYAAAGAAYYRVDAWDGAGWAEAARLPDGGEGYWTWRSGRLPDGAVATFRVVPVAAGGQDGTPTPFAALVVRRPDVPAAAYAYDAGTGTVTVSAA
ncbi:MAG TPA: hypothetical protein VF796_30860 [Humisphaera sp.]